MSELVVKTCFPSITAKEYKVTAFCFSELETQATCCTLFIEPVPVDPLLSHHLSDSISLKLCLVHSAWPAWHLSD